MSTVTEPDTTTTTTEEGDFPSIAIGLSTVTTAKKRMDTAHRVYFAELHRGRTHYKAGTQALTEAIHGLSDERGKLKTAKEAAGLRFSNRFHRGDPDHDDLVVFRRNDDPDTEVTEVIETHDDTDRSSIAAGNPWIVALLAFLGALLGYLVWNATYMALVFDKFANGQWNGEFFGTVTTIVYLVFLVGTGVALGGWLATRSRRPARSRRTTSARTRTTTSEQPTAQAAP